MGPGSVGDYITERGDVLLSVQLVLIREAERQTAVPEPVIESPPPKLVVSIPVTAAEFRAPLPVVAPPGPSPAPVAGVEPEAAPTVPAADHDPAPAPAPAPVPPTLTSVPLKQTPVLMTGPSTWMGMIDTGTGAAGVSALRRDLVLEQAWPTARSPSPLVLVATVESRGERRMGPPEADRVAGAMWELIEARLGPKDRCYRTGPCELSAILRGLDGRTSEDVARTIDEALVAAIAARVRGGTLRVTTIDPADAVRRLAALHWTDEVHEHAARTDGGLASAI